MEKKRLTSDLISYIVLCALWDEFFMNYRSDTTSDRHCIDEIIRDHEIMYHYSVKSGLNPLETGYGIKLVENILKNFLENYWVKFTGSVFDGSDVLPFREYREKNRSGDVVKHDVIHFMDKSNTLFKKYVSTKELREEMISEWYRVLLLKEKGLKYPRISGYFDPDEFIRQKSKHKNTIFFFVALNWITEQYYLLEDSYRGDLISVLDKFYEKKYLYRNDPEPVTGCSHLLASIKNHFLLYRGDECIVRYLESLTTNVINFSRYTWIKENISSWRDLYFLQSLRNTHELCSGRDSNATFKWKGNGIFSWSEMIRNNSLLNYLNNPKSRYSVWIISDDRMYDLIYPDNNSRERPDHQDFGNTNPGERIEFTGFIRNTPYWHPLFSLPVYPVYSPSRT